MKKFIFRSSILFGVTVITHGIAFAGATQKSFTPTKYVYPIMQIDLQTETQSGNQTIYKCPGSTPAECMVDLAESTGSGLSAITAAAQNVAVAAGTYTQIKLYNCPQTSVNTDTTTLTLQGSTSLGGGPTSYATTANGMTANATKADFTLTWACAGALVKLITPVVVTDGSAQALSLLIDLTNVAWTDSMATGGMGGCFTGLSGSQGICSSVPLVVPYFGTGTPTFERYLISHSSSSSSPALSDANAAVNLAIDPAGEVFFVGTQPYFTETSPAGGAAGNGGPDYNTATRTYSKNADGSIAFQTGGSIEDNRVGFTAFQRSTHTGSCKNELSNSASWHYQAFKQ